MREKTKKSSKFPLFFLLVLALIIIYLSFTYKNCNEKVLFREDTLIDVVAGSTFGDILGKYSQCPNWSTKLYLKLHTPSFSLQKGRFLIKSGSNLGGMLDQLKKPVNTDIKITLLEGWNIYDIDTKLSSLGLSKKGDFLEYIENDVTTLKKEFSFLTPVKSLEGYLYPDTYFINPNYFSLQSFTKQMLRNFESKVIKNIEFGSPENLYQVINLASIVEKEEKKASEKPRVAGILEKRIREGWMIGADATVCYPYKVTSDECTPNFILEKLYEKNEYNTRTKLGLPATPIGNPSLETIDAVIDDEEDTPYYFYLHDDKGGIHYARTNREHEENKRKYIYKK